MNAKPWYQSKTLWFNLLCALLAGLEANAGILRPYVSESFYTVFAVLFLPVGNVVLRFYTTQALSAESGS